MTTLDGLALIFLLAGCVLHWRAYVGIIMRTPPKDLEVDIFDKD